MTITTEPKEQRLERYKAEKNKIRLHCLELSKFIEQREHNWQHIDLKYNQNVNDFILNGYDIRYIIDSEKGYIGSKFLTVCGSKTIWINTLYKEVKGYYKQHEVIFYYDVDNLGLDAALKNKFINSYNFNL